jgi:hypothetical protein
VKFWRSGAFPWRFFVSFSGQEHFAGGLCEVLAVRCISLAVFVKFWRSGAFPWRFFVSFGGQEHFSGGFL